MKRIWILVLVIFLLNGCTTQTEKTITFDVSEAMLEVIDSKVSLTNQAYLFAVEINDDILAIITNDDYVDEYLQLYLKMLGDDKYSLDEIVFYTNYLVRKGESDFKLLETIMSDEYYLEKNLDRYFDYANKTAKSIREVVEDVNSWRDLKDYDDSVKTDLSKGKYVLVNKYHMLDSDYVPNDLVDTESAYGNVGKMDKEAYEAYKKMADAAKEEKLNFIIASPYRSYETQNKLYNKYLTIDSKENVDSYSARPGFSEHQTGLAVDILTRKSDFSNFEYTAEADWLGKHCYEYGFILRYPKDKEDVTGFIYEPWHFRYLGDLAEDVYKSGLTYDEYYEFYLSGE